MSKPFRHEQIMKAVRERPLHSQAELARALRRAGVRATQVTLSRDLKELGLVKTRDGYAPMSASTPAPDSGHVVREFVRDVRPAQNLLVLKTDPGSAPTVAAGIDALRWAEVAGTLAGDDTVLLVCADNREREAVQTRVRALLAVQRGPR